ncbi:hypothetical protein SAMN05421640_0383 [Ekhidna lutea]|uniref:Uncharacterized protein n=1 Tax=Ekhidna lutea TaxID=447679 RepID=A0A239EZR7_EKHLU|nr:hypothetical protein [Ekhidna lutea]SNS49402.1 hypothetical protein SAMN05421640_0383 [Ekhidna lutea]
MKNLSYILILVVLCACSSGKKLFEKGDYEAAVSTAVNRLQKSPGNKKARSTLKKAYPMAQKVHLNRIKQLKSSQDRFKWDRIASSYGRLNQMYDEIWRCPACMEVFPKVENYRNEFNDAAVLAADERYDAGVLELAKGTRESAIDAYRHFQRVQELRPNYKDTPQKLEESKYYATLKVVIDQIPVHSRSLGLSHEFFQNRLYEFVERGRFNEFVRFYSPAEANNEGLDQPDHIVVMQFDDFVVGQSFMKESTKQLTKDSVVVGQVEIEGVTRDAYGTVEAEYTEFSKYLDSRGLLDMKIFDARTNKILFQRKMSGEYRWLSEWASFQGDKRALSNEQLLRSKQREAPAPPPQFLFEQFCAPIYDQAVGHIRSFYRGY